MTVRNRTATSRYDNRQLVELALRTCDGDELAFADLCRHYDGLLHAIVLDYYAPGADREDLVQAARIALHHATLSFDPAAGVPFTPFAGMVIRRRVISAVKSATAMKQRPMWQSRLEEPFGDGNEVLGDALAASARYDPVAIVETREELQQAVAVVSRLTGLERLVLAHYLNGISYEETSRDLGCKVKTVDNALARARRKMRAGAHVAAAYDQEWPSP